MTILNVDLPEDVHRALRVECAHQDTNHAGLIGQLAAVVKSDDNMIMYRSFDYPGSATPPWRAVPLERGVIDLIDQVRTLGGGIETWRGAVHRLYGQAYGAEFPNWPVFQSMLDDMFASEADEWWEEFDHPDPDLPEDGMQVHDYLDHYVTEDEFGNYPTRFDDLIAVAAGYHRGRVHAADVAKALVGVEPVVVSRRSPFHRQHGVDPFADPHDTDNPHFVGS